MKPTNFAGLLLSLGLPFLAYAETPPPPVKEPAKAQAPDAPKPRDRETLEREFVDLLTNAKMTGSFSMRDSAEPKKDSYTILRAAKEAGDDWIITAKIEYRGLALPIDIRVQVKWAGDTPVICVTDKKILGFGTFTARVLFHGNQYAGTWSGGQAGGLMWGTIEKLPAEK